MRAEIDGQPLVLFEVQPATHRPVAFKGVEYIRVGSYKKKLKEHPEKERALWRLFDEVPFEKGVATGSVSSDDVLSLIDYPRYFELMKQRLPDSRPAILERLASEQVIIHKSGDHYDITNLGEMLFAKDLQSFGALSRKAPHGAVRGQQSRSDDQGRGREKGLRGGVRGDGSVHQRPVASERADRAGDSA